MGVQYTASGVTQEARAAREVIVCAGVINSPKLLELSGIGRREVLQAVGIAVVHELPGVGENLREHQSARVKFEITGKNLTFNDNANGWRLVREVAKFGLFGDGFLATSSVPIRIYWRTRPELEVPDAAVSVLPFIYEQIRGEWRLSKHQKGITMPVHVLRPESKGSVHVKSKNPAEPPAIHFNFLSAEQDRKGLIAAIRKMRELMAASPMAEVTGCSRRRTPAA